MTVSSVSLVGRVATQMTSKRPPGDLRPALVSAAAQLIAERGPTGFSMREVARRAGVSHAAPAHHFGDNRGLLTAVALEGFKTLIDAFDAAVANIDDPIERLYRMGNAYVSTALQAPGHFGVMCNIELVDEDDPELAANSVAAYQRLLATLVEIRDAINPDLDVDAAATMAWSLTHGLAVLAPTLQSVADRTGTETGPIDELMEKFNSILLNGLAARPQPKLASDHKDNLES